MGVAIDVTVADGRDRGRRPRLVTQQFNCLTAENAHEVGPAPAGRRRLRLHPGRRDRHLRPAARHDGHRPHAPVAPDDPRVGLPGARRAARLARAAAGAPGRAHPDGRRALSRQDPRLGRGQRGRRHQTARTLLRDSPWRRILGDDYVEQAFRLAAAADPSMELYYNDYGLDDPAKRDKTVRLIRRLQAAGIRVHAVGMQGHWKLQSPSAGGDRTRPSRPSRPWA